MTVPGLRSSVHGKELHPRRLAPWTAGRGPWAAAVLLATIAVGATVACRPAAAGTPRDDQHAPARWADIVLSRDSELRHALVPPRTTLAAILATHRLLEQEAASLIATIAQRFDVRRVRAGQPYRLDRYFDGRVRAFEYEIDHDRRVIVRRLEPAGPAAFEAEVAAIPRTVDQIIVHGTISRAAPTLVQALDAAGERIELSLALADVFSGEIDFNSDLQPGDHFSLLVERGTRADGAFAGYGPVLAAEFVNGGRRLQAVRFTAPGGTPGYYDAEGRSLKRFFLKTPLKFEPRITSSFSRARRHPVLNYTRAHNGVDYAAPTGAPVAAVSGGVVTFAGWTGGGGRTVKIRHGSGYESEYLHLSSIAGDLRVGMRVGQGQFVGRVGATGLATGPHLHYGLKRDGRYVNPAREHQNMPPGEPVATMHQALFGTERDRILPRLTTDDKARAVN